MLGPCAVCLVSGPLCVVPRSLSLSVSGSASGVGPQRSLSRSVSGRSVCQRSLSKSVSGPEVLSQQFLCRAPALFVLGPGALCAGALSVKPGTLCGGARRCLCRGPALSMLAHSAGTPTQRPPGPDTEPDTKAAEARRVCVRAPALFVSGLGGLCIAVRRFLLCWASRCPCLYRAPQSLCRGRAPDARSLMRSGCHPSGFDLHVPQATCHPSGSAGPQLSSPCHPSTHAVPSSDQVLFWILELLAAVPGSLKLAAARTCAAPSSNPRATHQLRHPSGRRPPAQIRVIPREPQTLLFGGICRILNSEVKKALQNLTV